MWRRGIAVGVVCAVGLLLVIRQASGQLTGTFFNWYDQYDPGFTQDLVQLFSSNGSAGSTTVTLNGTQKPVSWGALGEGLVGFPGQTAGPVTIASSGLVASQRVFYYNSFNEVYAIPTNLAASELVLTYYDLKDAGFQRDDIHVTNVSDIETVVTVSIGSSTDQLTLEPGTDGTVNFPGVTGGPVFISSNNGAALLASARTIYESSFNEVNAVPLSQANVSLVIAYYGGGTDETVHIANPNSVAVTATVSLPADNGICTEVTINPLSEVYVGCGGSPGPIVITSNGPLIASDRAFFGTGFSEAYAVPLSSASPDEGLVWYDNKDEGFAEGIFVYNPESYSCTVDVYIGGIFQTGMLVPAQSGNHAFLSGVVGGPVNLTSYYGGGCSFIASGRTVYNQSLNDVYAQPIQFPTPPAP